MAIEKYVSEPRMVPYAQEMVYNRLSNLKNLETMINPDKLAELQSRGIDTSSFHLEDFSATEESCSFKVNPLGNVTIEIVEKEPFKMVKFQGTKGVPFPATFWIQLVETGEQECKLRLTLHAELNMMIKMMVGSYLEKGIDKFADLLSRINYAAV
ncbi:MAG: hypothetical protein LWW85_10370 [Marinilabiliales bacterium]|nr:hypothetical protein [Marinilabiliales bacterium]